MTPRPPRSTTLTLAPLLAVLAGALPAGCSAVPDSADRAAPPAPPQPASEVFTRPATTGPDSTRLVQDVAWLADDAREGRRAGTAGEAMAASWLALRMEELGLRPAGDEGFLQPFEVPLEPEAGERSWIMWLPGEEAGEGTDVTPVTGADNVLPLFCSAGGGTEAPIVFAGYGMRNEDRDWDDYAEADVRGAIVVFVRGTPELSEETEPAEDASPHGGGGAAMPFGTSGSIFNKVMTAKHLGAAAVVLAQHPRDAGEPLLPFHNGHTAATTIPALTVSATVAEGLVPGYADRVAGIDAHAIETGERLAATQELGRAALSADVKRGAGIATNVLGLLPGRDRGRVVVLGAHFDHLGLGGTGSLARATWGEVHNGADDNASGTAVVLEAARLLAAGEPPSCDVLFALWSGEELGLLGSAHWIDEPTVPLERVVANLNFDMVGRAGGGTLQVLGAGTSPAFAEWMEPAGRAAGLDLAVNLSGEGIGGSDHQSFLRVEIPALHFFSGVHTDYHKPTDDVERFEAEGAARTVALALDLTRRIADVDELVYTAVEREEGGSRRQRGGSWSVTFGSVPAYDFQGEGLLLSGTSPGSPAERAGLLAGDVVRRVGDIEIGDIHDFVYALQVHKPGDVVEVRYLREGEPERVTLTLGSRELE